MLGLYRVTGAIMLVGALAASGWASAQERGPATAPTGPGVITDGAKGVSIGGAPAARAGDRTSDGAPIANGSPNVFINGRPAVTVGDTTGCGGVIVGGASGVFINGKPVARTGDATTGCPGRK
ncbi:MAG: PAAR domain-containing protein [Hyphomicrobiaceae bacterium]